MTQQLRVFHNTALTFSADQLSVVGSDYMFTDNTPPPPTNVLARCTVQWSAHGTWQARANVDVTQLSEIIGRLSPNDEPLAWPGRSGSSCRLIIPPGKIICAQFTVPAGIGPDDRFGIGGNSYVAGNPPLAPYPPGGTHILATYSISQIPGEIRAAPYSVASPTNTDSAFLRYGGGAATNFYAGISPGTWYLNIVPTNPAVPCGVPLVHTGRIV